MQPLRLSIPGSFWDTQIYAGRLYLFQRDGSLLTLNWDLLLERWEIGQEQKLAFECAFRRSDYLYKPEFRLLFSDGEIKSVVERKFARLSAIEMVVSPDQIRAATAGIQDSPFPFPHASSTIYNSQMYAGSQSGLFQASCNKSMKNPVSSRPRKMWDGSVFSIAASYDEIAVAAGDDGLFEIPARGSAHRDFTPRLEMSCTFCEWAFQSIFCSSQDKGAFLADFSKRYNRESEQTVRDFEGVVSSDDIFGEKGFSWGRQDKLYLATSSGLDVVQYRPWDSNRIVQLASHKDSGIDGEIVSGGVAFFGTVLELDDSLLILLSDGSRYEIGGDPISWKVFPKSRHYENHLHVIFEDRIDVFSFNQDYFVDQREKVFGNSYLALEFALASSSRRHFTPSFTAPLIDYRSLLIEEDPDEDEIDLFLENATAVRPKPRLTNGT